MGKYGLTLAKAPSGVYPLFAVMGFAIGGLGYFLSHMVRHQEHVFDRKNNNQPWQTVQQHQTTKMYNPTGHFKENWFLDDQDLTQITPLRMTVEIPEDFLAIDSSNKVHKKITLASTSIRQPSRSGTKVKVHYEGSLWSDGSVFDSSYGRGDPLEFSIGKGQVIKGWDIGIASMKVGEKAELLIQSDFAYGASGSPPKIPANAVLLFKVELVDMDESTADMSLSEKLAGARAAKDSGNASFKTSDFSKAVVEYERGVALLQETFGAEDEDAKEIVQLKISLNSNLAACLLKTKDASKALQATQKVLDLDAAHQKATYRHFQALLQLTKYAEAVAYLQEKRQLLEGSDVNVEVEVAKVKKLESQAIAKEKAIYSRMFA